MTKGFTRKITDDIKTSVSITSRSEYEICGNHEIISEIPSQDSIMGVINKDKEAIVKDVVNEVLSKDDLIQDYITPFLIKHLEKYLANPDILFEKDRKIEELEKRILILECEKDRLSREIEDLTTRVIMLE